MMMKIMFEIARLEAGLGGLRDLDWKAILIVCTVGAFIIGSILAIRNVTKQMLDEEDGITHEKKKGRK